MRTRSVIANAAWTSAALGRAVRFRQALRDPRAAQDQLLRETLQANADTVYGRRFRFGGIRSMEAYRAGVPLTSWEDYVPYIERIRAGEPRVLTRDAVRCLIPSSGSTSARKLVPYTGGLQRAFDRAIGPWIVDLYRRRPSLAAGRAYWSISPVAEEAADQGGAVPVGFDTDTAYLGGVLGRIVESTLAVPSLVRSIPDIEAFRYVTMLHLLHARDLRLISVWHPSFLLLLLETLRRYADRLLADVAQGTLTPPAPVPAAVRRALAPRLPRNRRRADELARSAPFNDADDASGVWPDLGLISAWGDGHADLDLDRVRRAFTGVPVQPKGLVATEGFVTLPFDGRRPLAVRSHVFEFLDDAGEVHGTESLEPGGVYSVVLTAAGGLYRYRLRDRVRVDGFCHDTPSLTFEGKEDGVSDRCGEKLDETFVARVVAELCRSRRLRPRFAMLAPRQEQGRWRYVLYLDADTGPGAGLESGLETGLDTNPAMRPLAVELDAGLGRNPHYRYCVRLGQLLPATVRHVPPGAMDRYLAVRRKRGMRPGDLKPPALEQHDGWDVVLDAPQAPLVADLETAVECPTSR